MDRIVAYYRVSTQKQGRSGLGLDAQQADVERYAATTGAVIVASYTETVSGKRRSSERVELAKAIAEAKAMRAVLVVAKLDRMGRRRADVLNLIDESGVKVVFADEPHASNLSIGIKAVIADDEGKLISARTKAALAAARRRGVRLGNPNGTRNLEAYRAVHGNEAAQLGARKKADDFAADLRSYVGRLATSGLGDAAIAEQMNAKGVPTRREGGRWHRGTVARLRDRLAI